MSHPLSPCASVTVLMRRGPHRPRRAGVPTPSLGERYPHDHQSEEHDRRDHDENHLGCPGRRGGPHLLAALLEFPSAAARTRVVSSGGARHRAGSLPSFAGVGPSIRSDRPDSPPALAGPCVRAPAPLTMRVPLDQESGEDHRPSRESESGGEVWEALTSGCRTRPGRSRSARTLPRR